MSTADLRQLIKLGDIDKLEQLVYEGQGKKLVGYQFASDPKIKEFIKKVPALMVCCKLNNVTANRPLISMISSQKFHCYTTL